MRDYGVRISMDGNGRYSDNILVERLWQALKYEEVYLKAYANATEAWKELGAYFRFDNEQRPHQALGHRTQAEAFRGTMNAPGEESNARSDSPERVLVSFVVTKTESDTRGPLGSNILLTEEDIVVVEGRLGNNWGDRVIVI